MKCAHCGKKLDSTTLFCPRCGTRTGGVRPGGAQNEPGMKWYKFLIYFALFFAALGSLISGFAQVRAGGMVSIFGYLNLAVAVLAFAARRNLAKRRRNGPGTFLAYFGAAAAVNVLAQMVTRLEADKTPLSLALLLLIGLNVLFFRLHSVYFRKREFMFVN